MATWRNTENHDPGDETPWSPYVDADDNCPFCGLRLRHAESWCTPVPMLYLWSEHELSPNQKSYDETITSCASPKCRAKAMLLANRLGIPAEERSMRRRHAYYMKYGEKTRW